MQVATINFRFMKTDSYSIASRTEWNMTQIQSDPYKQSTQFDPI